MLHLYLLRREKIERVKLTAKEMNLVDSIEIVIEKWEKATTRELSRCDGNERIQLIIWSINYQVHELLPICDFVHTRGTRTSAAFILIW